MAAPWQFPDEISVAQAYNVVFFTDYDQTTTEGLATLVTDHGAPMQTQWDTSVVQSVAVLVMDTTNTSLVGINVNGAFLQIENPGPWTAPSRGWLDDPTHGTNWSAGVVDISQLLTNNGYAADTPFTFMVGNTVMDSTNTYRLNNNNTNGGFLLAYNEGGLNGGDGDANEPIIYVNPPSDEPGSCDGQVPTIIGTADRDVIYGTGGADVIMTFGGKDVVFAGGGDDVICGGDGDDVLEGEFGNDRIFGGAGDDTLEGGVGDDYLDGGDGNDVMTGDSGNDHLIGGAGDDKLIGYDGDDYMEGGPGDDKLYGYSGNDYADGGDGTDRCDGSVGFDTAVNCEIVTNMEVVQ